MKVESRLVQFDREKIRQTDTNIQTDRKTHRQTDTHTNIQTDRHTDTRTDMQIGWYDKQIVR